MLCICSRAETCANMSRGTACRRSLLEMRLSSGPRDSASSQPASLQVQPHRQHAWWESADEILTCTPDLGSAPTSVSVPSCHVTCRTSQDERLQASQVTPVGGAGSGPSPGSLGRTDRCLGGHGPSYHPHQDRCWRTHSCPANREIETRFNVKKNEKPSHPAISYWAINCPACCRWNVTFWQRRGTLLTRLKTHVHFSALTSAASAKPTYLIDPKQAAGHTPAKCSCNSHWPSEPDPSVH